MSKAWNEAFALQGLGAALSAFARSRAEKKAAQREQMNFEAQLAQKALELEANRKNALIQNQMRALELARPTVGQRWNPKTQMPESYEIPAQMTMEQLRTTLPGLEFPEQAALPGARVTTLKEPALPGVGAGSPQQTKDLAKELGAYESQATEFEQITKDLADIREKNKNAYGGVAGGGITKLKSALNIGEDDPKFLNTVDTVNKLRGLVSRVLKSTFGAQLSDAEREYLNKVYGAAESFSVPERDIATTNVESMLKSKLEGQRSKVDALGRTYNISPSYQKRAPAVPEMSEEDKAAIEWANANPKDPRAVEIKARLGVK
jgi:hypothetical protein